MWRANEEALGYRAAVCTADTNWETMGSHRHRAEGRVNIKTGTGPKTHACPHSQSVVKVPDEWPAARKGRVSAATGTGRARPSASPPGPASLCVITSQGL